MLLVSIFTYSAIYVDMDPSVDDSGPSSSPDHLSRMKIRVENNRYDIYYFIVFESIYVTFISAYKLSIIFFSGWSL